MESNPSTVLKQANAQAVQTQVPPVRSPESIRLWLSICNTDIGFESLFEALTHCTNAAQKALHVKRVLIRRCIDQSNPIEMPTEHKRLKIDLNIGFRDIGLEWLLADLQPMGTPFQRNTFVLRQLYAIGNFKPGPQQANVPRADFQASLAPLPFTVANTLPVMEEVKGSATPMKPGFSRAAIDDIVAPRSH